MFSCKISSGFPLINFPFKYVKRFRTGEEWIFNLAADPYEKNNILNLIEDEMLLDSLRNSLDYIFLNQYLIENNQVFSPQIGL